MHKVGGPMPARPVRWLRPCLSDWGRDRESALFSSLLSVLCVSEQSGTQQHNRGRSHIAPKNAWKTLGALLSPFFPKRSGGCAPEAFVVAKQPSGALSVTRRCGALAAFWKVEMFLSRCGADAPGKNERVAPRPRRFHYERAYRAPTFEITNLSAQKMRYVSGPLLCCCVPLCSLTHRTLRREQRALSLSLPQSLRFAGFFR